MASPNDRLVEAETAYHDLQIGRAVVRVRDANGEEVTYTTANRGALASYIADLRNQLTAPATPCVRPMRVIF